MKKIILFLLLVFVSVSASARKSYIIVRFNVSELLCEWAYLTGDVPDNIENYEGFRYEAVNNWWVYNSANNNYRRCNIGDILNFLSEYGYEVEFVNNDSNSGSVNYLLSKEVSSGQSLSDGDVNKDGEVNISDVNRLVALILEMVRKNPSILEQIKE